MTDTPVKHRSLPPDAEPQFVRRAPAPELAGLVDSMVGYAEDGTPLSLSVEMAPLVVPLVISFGEPFEIAFDRAPRPEDRHGSFASGLHPGYVLINSTGRSQCVQVDFTPLGAFRFFRRPMHELAGAMVSLDDLADPELGRLRQRLGELSSWAARLQLVEAFVLGRIRTAPDADAAVRWAWNALVASGGAIRVQHITDRLDWSRRRLAGRFREQVGIGPKAVARMARFNRAVALAARDAGTGWADIAFACGYADQAHLAREFQEFGGRTPGAWRAALPA